MAAFYLFAIILAAVACILCTTTAVLEWSEGEDMNWYLLALGIINGVFFVMDTCFFLKDILHV